MAAAHWKTFLALIEKRSNTQIVHVSCACLANTLSFPDLGLETSNQPDKFENGVFILKMQQMFNIKTQQSLAILNLCLSETLTKKSPDYRDVIVFEKLCFQNVLRPH